MKPIYVQLQLFAPPPPPPPPPKPKSAGIFTVGDLVEIRSSDLLYGKRAVIIDFDQHVAIVRADGWVINRHYPLNQLILVRRESN